MRARANFECKSCQVAKGDPAFKILNLPIDSQRCPLCGKKRGFKRLFDAINVNSRHSPHKHRYIDRQLEPAMNRKTSIEDGARRFEKSGKEIMERAWEKTDGAGRQKLANEHPETIAAMQQGKVSQMVPAAIGRNMPLTGNITTDNLQGATQRRVVPDWVRTGRGR